MYSKQFLLTHLTDLAKAMTIAGKQERETAIDAISAATKEAVSCKV